MEEPLGEVVVEFARFRRSDANDPIFVTDLDVRRRGAERVGQRIKESTFLGFVVDFDSPAGLGFQFFKSSASSFAT